MMSEDSVRGCKVLNEKEKEDAMKRLPKRLAYVLRYGALKEGLMADDNGYVELSELTKVPLLKAYSQDELLKEVQTSTSYRKTQRYELREKDGRSFVRAAYLRNFEKSRTHPGTKVNTLYESSLSFILSHLDDYDLENFPDESIIRAMIHRVKIEKRASVKVIKALLVPTITRLDLEGIYLTNGTLKALWTQCPYLKAVSLKDCGYIITDTVLAQLAKNLPGLQQLNLCGCTHLTSNCFSILAKRLPHFKVLHIAAGQCLTFDAVLAFLHSAKELSFLDVFYLRTNVEQYNILMDVAKEKNVELIVRTPKGYLDQGSETGSEGERDSVVASGGEEADQANGDFPSDAVRVQAVVDSSQYLYDDWGLPVL